MQSTPIQLKLVYPIPVVVGNHEYLKLQRILQKINILLVGGNLEEIASSVLIQNANLNPVPKH